MGMFSAFGRVFGGKKAPAESAAAPNPLVARNGSAAAAARPPAGPTAVADPDDDLEIELDDASGDFEPVDGVHANGDRLVEAKPETGSGRHLAPAALKNRQELLQELQKNYNEVLGLVRKVDLHLDRQEQRSERMLQLAERVSDKLDRLDHLAELDRLKKLDGLDEIRTESAAAAASIREMHDLAREHQSRTDERLDRQTETLGGVRQLLQDAERHDEEIATSLDAFRNSMGGMADATGRLGEALAQMRQTDLQREEQVAKMIARSQRGMVIAIGLVVAIGAIAIAAVLLAGR